MDSLDDVRRRFEDGCAQDIGDCCQARLIFAQTICIACREFRDLPSRLTTPDLQETSIIQGQKVGDRTLHDAQPAGAEIEITDDLRVQ
jgi:hypothetical protein